MKNIHIENSYKIWKKKEMHEKIFYTFHSQYRQIDVENVMHRTYESMFLEWYLHNIGYWITLPFIKNQKIKALNERFKHVDLEEHSNGKM